MDNVWMDLRFAARQLRRAPGFTLAAVLTLALGIGANGAMFSLADGFLWQPLPVAAPEQLVNIFEHDPAADAWGDLSYADYRDVRDARDVFADVIAYYPYPFALSEGGRHERLWGEIVSGNFFAMLGVPAAAGRAFGVADTVPGAAPVAVISDGFWRRRFAADPGAVGRTVKLNGRAFTVIGVAPAAFHSVYYVGFRPDLWVPASQLATVYPSSQLDARDGPQFRMMARLAPGVSLARAQAAVSTIMARLDATYPATHRGRQATVLPEREARPEPGIAGGFGMAARLFLVAVGLVLLIACANVANLLLARATGRRREIAIRLALGASRGRVIRQLLAESLLLAGLGAVAGAGLAVWASGGVAVLLRLPTDIPFVFDFAVNGRALAYIGAVAASAGVVFGLTPALQAARPELVGALKNEAVSSRGVHRSRLRAALVTGQIAVSCVLLIVAGLAVRTLVALRNVGTGFDAQHSLLVGVAPELQGYTRARGEAFYRELARRVAELPGVRAVSAAQYVPLDFASNGGRIFVEGHAAPAGDRGTGTAGWSQVLPGFFDALGVRLAEGRDFTERDDSAAPPVAIVNATLARRYWQGGPAIGRRLRLDRADAPPVTVVGVAPDMVYGNPNEPPRPYLYLPITQRYSGEATLLVRGAGDPLRLVPAVTGVIAALEPELPVDVRGYASLVTGRALLLPRFAATLAGAFGALALVLAVVGLYGVVAYTAGQRVREIGIRIALGADRRAVLALIVGGGLRQALVGVAIGVVLALGATQLMRGLLYGVGAVDPVTFALVPLTLVAIAALASFVPAHRASRVDPMVALRSE